MIVNSFHYCLDFPLNTRQSVQCGSIFSKNTATQLCLMEVGTGSSCGFTVTAAAGRYPTCRYSVPVSNMLNVPPATATPITDSTELTHTHTEQMHKYTSAKIQVWQILWNISIGQNEVEYSQVALAERLNADCCFHTVSEPHLNSVTRFWHNTQKDYSTQGFCCWALKLLLKGLTEGADVHSVFCMWTLWTCERWEECVGHFWPMILLTSSKFFSWFFEWSLVG